MRILLVSSPRSASKLVHKNLLKYIDNKECNITLEDRIDDSITNWFESYSSKGTKLVGNIKQIDKRFILEKNKDFDIDIEMHNRINLLVNYQYDLIVKIHPIGNYALAAIDRLKNHYDYFYTLNRQDFIEHSMSVAVSNAIGIYQPGLELDFEISNKICNPDIIDLNKVLSIYNMICNFETYLKAQNSTKNLYFEDIIKIKNSYDFCDYLNLPRKEFQVITRAGLEYGDNKSKMFKNYEHVRKYLLYKYNDIQF